MTDSVSLPPVETPAFWELYMRLYDEGVATLWPYRELLAEMERATLDHLPERGGARVLDAGCGTGLLLARLAKSPRVAQIVGIDRSAAALDRARTKVHQAQTARNGGPVLSHDLYEGDLNGNWTQAPRPIGRVTTLVSMNVLYTLREPLEFFRKAGQVVPTGGWLVLTSPHQGLSVESIVAAHVAWLRERATPEEREADERLAQVRVQVRAVNERIVAANRTQLTFVDEYDLVSACERNSFRVREMREAYAGTNLLVVAEKVA